MARKTIVLIGTLDTKGPEVAFLRDYVWAQGQATCVVDAGLLDPPAFAADVSRKKLRWRAARAWRISSPPATRAGPSKP